MDCLKTDEHGTSKGMSQTLSDMQNYLQETADELNSLMSMDVMEMYRYLTELGTAIVELPSAERTPDNFVHGCISSVYVAARLENGLVQFAGSSEALIVRGYLAVLIVALSGLTPSDILAGSQDAVSAFAEGTNIRATLTPSRANAFGNIYKLMREKARALVSS